MTRKQIRALVRKLREPDEALRQKVLCLIRNAPSKEQAAYEIVTKLHLSQLDFLQGEARKISKYSKAEIQKLNEIWETQFEKLNQIWEAKFEKLKESLQQDDQDGEDWKR